MLAIMISNHPLIKKAIAPRLTTAKRANDAILLKAGWSVASVEDTLRPIHAEFDPDLAAAPEMPFFGLHVGWRPNGSSLLQKKSGSQIGVASPSNEFIQIKPCWRPV
jgi:hypothetical protein